MECDVDPFFKTLGTWGEKRVEHTFTTSIGSSQVNIFLFITQSQYLLKCINKIVFYFFLIDSKLKVLFWFLYVHRMKQQQQQRTTIILALDTRDNNNEEEEVAVAVGGLLSS